MVSDAAGSLRAAAARRAPRGFGGALVGVVGAVLLALAPRDLAANGPAAGGVLLVALAGGLARRSLARVGSALPSGVRARLRRARRAAGLGEAAVAVLVGAALLVAPDRFPVLSAGLAGFLMIGVVARLTLCAVLRHALDAADPDDR